MNIAELSIQKKTVTLVLSLCILIGGLWSYVGLGRLEDPEFTIKEAVVFTPYPGATSMEVTEEVTDRIETAIQQMPELDYVKSTSLAGVSIVTVKIKDHYGKADLPQIWDLLRRKMGDIRMELPPGAQAPIVNDNFGDVYGILLAVTGEGYSFDELKEYMKFLRKELLLVEGVSKIELWGLREEAVFVEISRARMATLGIGLDAIYSALEAQNLVVASGSAKVGPEYIRINPTGSFDSVKDIANLQVRDPASGKGIFLKDVATVSRGYTSPPERVHHFNGIPGVSIGISVVPGGNVVTLGALVKERLNELEARRPIGMDIGVVNFQADDVSKAVNGFVVNFVEAVVIVVLVLLVFMGLRSGLLIGAILALTVLATLVAMKVLGIDLQRISLGALIIALGMLVDNAIVVTEGMLIRIEKGMDRLQAAKEVVGQNAMPLFGATVIAVLAFAAIGLSQDDTGEYCRSLFQVMLISLMISWVIGVTITPLFCALFLKGGDQTEGEPLKDPYEGRLFRGYKHLLTMCLKRRWLTMAVMGGLLGLSIAGFGTLKDSFFPESVRPQFKINYWLPAGTDIRKTTEDISRIEQRLKADPRVTDTASYIGDGATRFMLTFEPENTMDKGYGLILVSVKDFNAIDEMIADYTTYLHETFPDAQPILEKFKLGTATEAVAVRFSGPDPSVLRQLSHQAKMIFEGNPHAYAVRDDWRQKVKVIRPQFDETRARLAGVTRADLARALEMNVTGSRIGVYREKDELLPIVVRQPKEERLNVENIRNLQVWSPATGQSVPVRQIVSGFTTEWEDAKVFRRDRRLTITAKCENKPGILPSTIFKDIQPKIEAMELPNGYTMEWGGEYEGSVKARANLATSMPFTFAAMVLVVIMLFNCLRQPLIIWLTVPLAIIGVTIGLMIFDLPFDFMALLGFLSLVGMLIKGAIVLIDQINLEIAEGKAPYEAVVDSSVSRMRPVCMAAVTTVLGMIPLIPDIFFKAMAVTVMSGLSFATILTLIVVPVLYVIFYTIPAEG
ncbi:efflux RND transporter permease subunit [Desulfoluna spongiiphila]|uniref:Multidrug efflux pump subunit AcrB n=1 Tax=Desulfoluna spongiiphila TaxID=419481 RepID=A0A1G5AEN9_9BACT|nr:efflux RND transporter permease subunit [Desulfoluna spongiiphila]SCX76363.1 Multidrug efflux pump subunit AcrB [Desulfoluna spongiiphila]